MRTRMSAIALAALMVFGVAACDSDTEVEETNPAGAVEEPADGADLDVEGDLEVEPTE